jgi:hypothetical protein
MVMNNQSPHDRLTFFAGVLVGGIGAIGQSMLLHNTLVWSYPFKMMSMPPAAFYASIGQLGAYISPLVAIAIALYFKSAKKYLVPAIPVVLCPLTYWLIFEISFFTSSYKGVQMLERNFEGYTGETARYNFGFEILSLIFWGALIGLVAGMLIGLSSKLFVKKWA